MALNRPEPPLSISNILVSIYVMMQLKNKHSTAAMMKNSFIHLTAQKIGMHYIAFSWPDVQTLFQRKITASKVWQSALCVLFSQTHWADHFVMKSLKSCNSSAEKLQRLQSSGHTSQYGHHPIIIGTADSTTGGEIKSSQLHPAPSTPPCVPPAVSRLRVETQREAQRRHRRHGARQHRMSARFTDTNPHRNKRGHSPRERRRVV